MPVGRSERFEVRTLLLFVALLSGVLVVVGALFAEKRSQVALEAAKAGLQLGVITLTGAAVSEALRRLAESRELQAREAERLRERRQALYEYRLAVYRDAVDAYNQVKTVRRALRAAGLARSLAGEAPFTAHEKLDDLMLTLNGAELTFEKIRREVVAQPAAFPTTAGSIEATAKLIEDPLREVLKTWEQHGHRLAGDTDVSTVEELEALRTFLGPRTSRTDWFGAFEALERSLTHDLLRTAGVDA